MGRGGGGGGTKYFTFLGGAGGGGGGCYEVLDVFFLLGLIYWLHPAHQDY